MELVSLAMRGSGGTSRSVKNLGRGRKSDGCPDLSTRIAQLAAYEKYKPKKLRTPEPASGDGSTSAPPEAAREAAAEAIRAMGDRHKPPAPPAGSWCAAQAHGIEAALTALPSSGCVGAAAASVVAAACGYFGASRSVDRCVLDAARQVACRRTRAHGADTPAAPSHGPRQEATDAAIRIAMGKLSPGSLVRTALREVALHTKRALRVRESQDRIMSRPTRSTTAGAAQSHPVQSSAAEPILHTGRAGGPSIRNVMADLARHTKAGARRATLPNL